VSRFEALRHEIKHGPDLLPRHIELQPVAGRRQLLSFQEEPNVRQLGMELIGFFKRLLAIFTIAAIAFAPISAGSVAQATDGGMAQAMADMPCCPHDTPAMPDSQKSCPFAVLCSMCFPAIPTASIAMPARFAVADVRMPREDIWRDLLLDPPLPKPPQA